MGAPYICSYDLDNCEDDSVSVVSGESGNVAFRISTGCDNAPGREPDRFARERHRHPLHRAGRLSTVNLYHRLGAVPLVYERHTSSGENARRSVVHPWPVR